MNPSFLLFCLASMSVEPSHQLETAPSQQITAELSCHIRCEKLTAGEWIVFVPVAPVTAGQQEVRTEMTPAGKEVVDLSELQRPLLLARVPADSNDLKHGIKLKVVYEAKLWSRRLVPLRKGDRTEAVKELNAKDREAALRSVGHLKHDDKTLADWLATHDLLRNTGESDIDYARRVFTAIRREFTYDYQPDMDRTPASVCNAGKSDCGGLSNLFVALLRSRQIPARTLAGRWAISANPEEKLNGHAYSQYHVKAEFFAAGVGWVPVDIASGILHDRSPEGLRYFGNDPGDFLVQHIDSNLEVDTIHFGKQSIVVLQRPAFWVTGSGTLDDLKLTDGWVVKQTPVPGK